MPPRTVYIIGAGANRGIYDFYGNSPPLMNDVFITARRLHGLSKDTPWFKESFEFVESTFGISSGRLISTELSWEECIDAAVTALERAKTDEERIKLSRVRLGLVRLLASTLVSLETEGVTSEIMRELGEIILHESATTITFNYDCILEEVLEGASGIDPDHGPPSKGAQDQRAATEAHYADPSGVPLPPPMLDFRWSRWTRSLGYGIPFDFLTIRQFGGHGSYETPGEPYFRHPENLSCQPPVLKLHGSLNWFRFTDSPVIRGQGMPDPDLGLAGKLVLDDRAWSGSAAVLGSWPSKHNLYLDPVLATGKDKGHQLSEEPFPTLWRLAHDALVACDRLVVIGYSFPESDRKSTQLVTDALSARTKKVMFEWVAPSTRHAYDTQSRLGLDASPIHWRTVSEYVLQHPNTRGKTLSTATMIELERRRAGLGNL